MKLEEGEEMTRDMITKIGEAEGATTAWAIHQ